MSKYPYIEGTADEEILYQHLSDYALQIINYILEAYASGKIDFIEPRYPNGEYDFTGFSELVIKDPSYKEIGSEVLVMEWIEGHDSTEHLIECMQDIQNKYLVSYIKDDFAQNIVVNAKTADDAKNYMLHAMDCEVFSVASITPSVYVRLIFPEVSAN